MSGLILFVSLSAFAAEKTWPALTTARHPHCHQEAPCRLIEPNGVFEVQVQTKNVEGRLNLSELKIKNMKNGKAQLFKMDEVNQIEESDYFRLFTPSLRPHVKDLTLQAYSSARAGEVYYYFLYDEKAQVFVMSEGTFPKLKFDAKTKQMVNTDLDQRYSLGENLKIRDL